TFADKTVANSKTVTLTGATLAGTDADNYALDSVATTTGNITARAITFKADDLSRTYGESTPAFSYSIASGSLVTGDTFGTPSFSAAGSTVGSHAITLRDRKSAE